MSGVMIDGIQWERCNCCARWVKYADLRFDGVHPSIKNPWPDYPGLDLCPDCVNGTPHKHSEEYQP